MADTGSIKYTDVLAQSLLERKEWLEKSEIAKFKEELRIFQISYSVLYNLFLKKKLIHEDPYKQETKISDLTIPETGPINEAKRLEQISLRLANFDSQLDFLVNFYQFGVDFLNLERIRKILGLIRYIDWTNLTPDSPSHNTRAVAEIALHSKSGGDQLTLSVIGESLTKLPKCTAAIIGILRNLHTYHKENYKLTVRGVIQGMPPSEVNSAAIKKKLNAVMPGTPFFQDFAEEIIKEDYAENGADLQMAVLNSLKVVVEKPKVVKQSIDYKKILLDGVLAIGAAAPVLNETAKKIDENEMILENQKRSFWYNLKKIIRTMMHSEPEEKIYDLQYIDHLTGVNKKENLNFVLFRADLEKRIRILSGMNLQGQVYAKLKGMNEDQITGYLEKTIKDIQYYYRILMALDEYFKSGVAVEDRGKVKGIKPELVSIKNSFVKANQLRHEYISKKEEEEQIKRLEQKQIT